MAGYAAQLEQYQKAIDIYEQVGAGLMPAPLLSWLMLSTYRPIPHTLHAPSHVTSWGALGAPPWREAGVSRGCPCCAGRAGLWP